MIHALIPASTPLAGYCPSTALGLGDNLPAGVGLEWASWCRDPGYHIGVLGDEVRGGFAAMQGKLRAYWITDDRFAPRGRGIHRLLPERASRDPRRGAARTRRALDRALRLLPRALARKPVARGRAVAGGPLKRPAGGMRNRRPPARHAVRESGHVEARPVGRETRGPARRGGLRHRRAGLATSSPSPPTPSCDRRPPRRTRDARAAFSGTA